MDYISFRTNGDTSIRNVQYEVVLSVRMFFVLRSSCIISIPIGFLALVRCAGDVLMLSFSVHCLFHWILAMALICWILEDFNLGYLNHRYFYIISTACGVRFVVAYNNQPPTCICQS
jgi:hypothetical protein